MKYHSNNTLETVKEIESEIIRFQSILEDVKEKTNILLKEENNWNNERSVRNGVEPTPKSDTSISATKESSALKSSWKSMKYKLDKLIL